MSILGIASLYASTILAQLLENLWILALATESCRGSTGPVGQGRAAGALYCYSSTLHSITVELEKRTQGTMKWTEIQAKLPADQTPEAKAVRSKLFHQFDPNGNGYLSLAEVDKGVQDVLGLEDVYESKPAIIRAFAAAKNAGKSKAKLGADFVERSEFRLLLLYLGKYYELYEMFSTVDRSHDRRLTKAEFKTAVAHFEKWGIKVENPDADFETIDVNKGGFILFDEFADWGIKQHLELVGDEE